jgi:TonB family protein
MPAIKLLRSFVVCLGLVSLNVASWSQTPAAAPPIATPVAPDEFMRQAADAMSLTAPDMKPWHLRARVKQFAEDGSAQRETVMEEWWLNPDHFKVTYTGPDFARTEYRSGESDQFTGSDNVTAFATGQLLHPLPYPTALDAMNYVSKEVLLGTNKLQCFTGTLKSQPVAKFSTTYCFDTTLPILRMNLNTAGQKTIWNAVVRVHGHYFAKQIRSSLAKLDPWQTIDVESVDPQLGIDEASLVPPADARPFKRRVSVSPAVMAGKKISGDNPYYPETAKSVRTEGTVVLSATISKEGTVENIKVVSGPLVLQPGAVNAVKTWRYEPYLLDGQPVEVGTTVTVVFNLGFPAH